MGRLLVHGAHLPRGTVLCLGAVAAADLLPTYYVGTLERMHNIQLKDSLVPPQ